MNTEVTPSQTTAMSDEISLVDLLRVLIKRKNTLLAVFFLFVLGGVAAALLLAKQYQYTTTIEIGTTVINDGIHLIEEPQNLLTKIQENYIPLALLHYHEAHPENKRKYILTAMPKGNKLIMLEAKGSEEEADSYKHLQNDVVDQIIQDHSRKIFIHIKKYQLASEKIQNEIANLEYQVKLLQAESKRLVDNEKLLTRHVKETRELVSDAITNREKVSKEIKNEARAMTLLMIDFEIQRNRQRLYELEKKLAVELNYKRDEIEKELKDAQHKIMEMKSELAIFKLQRENLRETRSIVPPMRSLESVGMGKIIIVLLAAIIGFFVALFTVFVHELIIKARTEIN